MKACNNRRKNKGVCSLSNTILPKKLNMVNSKEQMRVFFPKDRNTLADSGKASASDNLTMNNFKNRTSISYNVPYT